ncbi:hypothetical protein FBUS_07636 [Fasciolopsis buskii]|uniref:Uncharacterized protein n=1 Tax=Fasciolopsis buskii TaxID=27845 RepID=A0A8E0RXX4_9TREM|nr:hypothetical protein FBUS_07636 [Fasciolopsis buski]
MPMIVDYSYRHPIDRSPRFPLLPAAQFNQANQTSITGATGQYEAIYTDVDFDSQPLGPRSSGVILKQYNPIQRDMTTIQPGRNLHVADKDEPPAQRYKPSDFHRYRRLKDYRPDKVPRIEDVLAYKYCPTCCALHVGACIGCRRDERYATQLGSRRLPWHHPQPRAPYGRGLYGYLHEKLDSHKTGNFWLSKYH